MRRMISIVAALVLVMMALPLTATAKDGGEHKFTAELSGAQEVAPVVTDATGNAKFNLKDGRLKFGLKVKDIENVVAAHIHCGAAGTNGPIGITLFAGGVTPSGTLAKGHIDGPNPGNACGWVDMDDVLEALRSGDTYVNVHTVAHPPGEIRGQIH